jgi:alginate O-acetyltransferase complex protein AlgI
MSFASRSFFIFLPIVLLGYHLCRRRSTKYNFLLVASWVFYMSWNPWLIWVILFTSTVDYWAGRLIEDAATPRRRRAWLMASLFTNLGFLCVFKYAGFVVNNSLALAHALGCPVPTDWELRIILPLGISFHTFQGISYTFDVYQGRVGAVRNFRDFALFVAFFPQLVVGPIVRAVEFLPQMVTPPAVTARQAVEGPMLFVLGLFKKLFIADRLAQFVDVVFADPGSFDAVTQRWAVIAYAAQIYCDFSGYTDIALGTAKMFGFELPPNFCFPYLAGSITEFWKRWHMSLSAWLKDYLYIPLGGSRKGTPRTYFNLILTMTVCGLWHGATWNYVLWGFYTGLSLAAHRVWDRALRGRAWADRIRGTGPYHALAVACTFILFAVGLIVLRSEHWANCWVLERSWLDWGLVTAGTSWLPAWVPPLVALVAAGHLLSGLRGTTFRLLESPPLVQAAFTAAALVLLVVFGAGQTKAFIYFQF